MALILIGCEESQIVCKEFRKLGHEAYSCDVIESSGGKTEWHLQMDIFEAIKLKKWDMMIAFPPCTYLTVTRNKWFKPEFDERFPTQHQDREDAKKFFIKIAEANIARIAIENPIGIMSKAFRKPDQIIQPYYFGDAERKTTCLWLKNLPPLQYALVDNLFEKQTSVKPELITTPAGDKLSKWHYDSYKLPNKEKSKLRSKTFLGFATAMAVQWSEYLSNNVVKETK